MEEIWQKNKDLIPKEEWGCLINSLKTAEQFTDREKAKKILKEKLITAIKNRLPPYQRIGIFFSGGVDSSLIAAISKHLNAPFNCYTVGFQEDTKEPEDVIEAKKVAQKLNFNFAFKIFNLSEAEEIIKKTVAILKPHQKTDVVNVGVGAVVVAAVELAKKDHITHFFSGLGSEEIFAGYERHDKAKDINKECWQGLKEMWTRDLVRDFNLAKEANIILSTPFLDKELIKLAMQLPEEWKINYEGKKKYILREVAAEFLGEFAWRKKKAAQYGSCFDKAIKKLASNKGFKFKKDYLDSLR